MIKVGVIGLGLIGGSIFKDLTKLGFDCVGISKSQKGITNVYSDYECLRDRDVVFVCKEMRKTLETLDELNKYIRPETIVTDVCSLKGFLANGEYVYKFIPSHPMAGTEFSGWDNSLEGLFKGAKWVITPLEKDYKSTILEDLIKELGAEVVYATPEEHDEAVALISHMPMVLSQAIYNTAKDNKLALKLASSGFRDMTRLSLSSIDMAEDMVEMNSKNIQTAILNLYKSVGELTSAEYRIIATQIKAEREKMYEDGINIL